MIRTPWHGDLPRAKAACMALLLAALTACTTAPKRTDVTAATGPAQPFEVMGRISAKRGSDGLAASFTWAHLPGTSDRIDLATPLGQVIARLSGDASRVQVERGNGQVQDYPDWAALTRAVFGVTIPVEELSWWIRAVPRSGVPFGAEPDAQGRPLTLRQQGWEVEYAYRDDAPATLPYRLIMRSADAEPIDVRVVIDRWSAPAP